MKRKYIAPVIMQYHIQVNKFILSGSTGDINSLGINSSESITGNGQFGSRRGNAFWDDEDEY